MGQAQLEIVITDQGSAPVGQPPPAAITASSQAGANPVSSTPGKTSSPTTAGESESDGHLREGITVLAKILGGGELVRVAETFEKAAEWMATAAKAQDTQTAQPSKSTGGINPAGSVGGAGEAGEGVEAAGAGEAIAGAGEGAAVGVAGIAAMAAPVALATAAVVGLGYAAKKVSDQFDSQAHALAMYSGVLAEATARADIRAQMAQMDQANSLGSQLADFEDTYSKLQQDGTKILTAIEEVLLAIFQPILESIEPQVRLMTDILKVIADAVAAVLEAMTGHIPTAVRLLGKIIDDMKVLGEDLLNPNAADALADPLGDMVFQQHALTPPVPNQGAGANPNGAAVGGIIGSLLFPGIGNQLGQLLGAFAGGS